MIQNYPHYMTWLWQAVTPDSTGDPVESWSPTVQGGLWGEIQETTSQTNEVLGADRSQVQATIILRNRPGIKVRDKLVYNSRTWIVDGIKRREPDGLILDAYEYDIAAAEPPLANTDPCGPRPWDRSPCLRWNIC